MTLALGNLASLILLPSAPRAGNCIEHCWHYGYGDFGTAIPLRRYFRLRTTWKFIKLKDKCLGHRSSEHAVNA
ncbi:hypothetical protein VTN31DRAFT_5789 [Thermomyces dupontii]|uniref:uncharacterized protein n=1 Tax=Talaromyces thermophilus TaxID=28565 RepID=UPI003743C465